MSGCPTCREPEHECRSWDWSGHCEECGEKTLPEWERELLARQEQPAQPDRPAPVDPSEVRVGDVLADAPSPEILRETANILATRRYPHGETAAWLRQIADAIAPEPDPQAVDRMLNALEEADSVLGEREQEDWRALARELVRTLATIDGAKAATERAEKAEAAIERVRAVLGEAHEVIDRGGIRREACIAADRVRAALDGSDTP